MSRSIEEVKKEIEELEKQRREKEALYTSAEKCEKIYRDRVRRYLSSLEIARKDLEYAEEVTSSRKGELNIIEFDLKEIKAELESKEKR